ncbi:hypothetical protein QTP86_020644, partial [Hemibagrus guttatus]
TNQSKFDEEIVKEV